MKSGWVLIERCGTGRTKGRLTGQGWYLPWGPVSVLGLDAFGGGGWGMRTFQWVGGAHLS